MAKQRRRLRAIKNTHSDRGVRYDFKSKLELAVFKTIKSKIKHKKEISLSYETEKLPYILEKNYVPDFILSSRNGKTIYIEVKGYLRPEDRTKAIAVKQAHPDKEIRFVFASNNNLYKGSKTRYSDWCEKYGFPYCFKDGIPDGWFK